MRDGRIVCLCRECTCLPDAVARALIGYPTRIGGPAWAGQLREQGRRSAGTRARVAPSLFIPRTSRLDIRSVAVIWSARLKCTEHFVGRMRVWRA